MVLQKLKAALDEALAAFLRHALDAAAMMSRMLLCVIVQPIASLGGTSGLATADLTFQLHEIEVSPAQVQALVCHHQLA